MTSTFSAPNSSSARSKSGDKTPDTPAGPVHILLVDDDRLVLTTLSDSVSQLGYQLSTAETAEEAQELLASGLKPDLAILDVRMPGVGGLALAHRLHALDHIPFIMLSAYSDAQTLAQATRDGALAFLVKPLDEAQLGPAITAALARADEMGQLRQARQHLQTALDQERNINVAVGITMMQYRVSRTAAFDLLRSSARSRNLRLAQVATDVVTMCESLGTAGGKT